MSFPNTQTTVDSTGTSTGLSTQIIIQINDVAVGALQSFQVAQARGLNRVKEIGTDGVIEIVPQQATEFTITANRLVFDQLRLPEAFQRGFRFINAQRIPFEIKVFDVGQSDPLSADPAADPNVIVMTYTGCWFSDYSTPFNADNYLITETATIWAENGFVSAGISPDFSGITGRAFDFEANAIEQEVNFGSSGRRGALDAAGMLNAKF